MSDLTVKRNGSGDFEVIGPTKTLTVLYMSDGSWAVEPVVNPETQRWTRRSNSHAAIEVAMSELRRIAAESDA